MSRPDLLSTALRICSAGTLIFGTLCSLVLCAMLSGCASNAINAATTSTTISSATAPGAPTSVSATAGNGSATVTFTAPSSNGGATITSYTVTCTANGTSVTGTGTGSPIVVTGLTNGTTYTCSVRATNADGTGTASATVTVTPSAGTASNGTFTLTSSAATNGGTLPAAYTCDGTGSTLPLAWSNPPSGTASFALLLSTAPTTGTVKYDWVLYNIDSTVTSLAQDSFLVGTLGQGDDGPGAIYDPPCSQGPGAKVYTFTLYALSVAPTFSGTAPVTGETLATTIASSTIGTASISVSYTRDPATAPGSGTNCSYIKSSLNAQDGTPTIGCDGTYAYIGSIGLPVGTVSDQTMNGITSTNLQVPTATDFQGANGWKIPLAPALASTATSVSAGPIGVAINGVPIFNPCDQSGNCTATSGNTLTEGQLDTCNGHAGRADDYHYHAAPTCLMAEQTTSYWNTHPVAWLLDGFAVFGFENADGTTPSRDTCGGEIVSGTQVPTGYPYTYAYHVTNSFPYITDNCLSGVPSPDLVGQGGKYFPMRQPSVTPFNNTAMTLTTASDGYQVLQFTTATAFTATETGSDSYAYTAGTYRIRYKQVTGSTLDTLLAQPANAGDTACYNFEFTDTSGNTTQPTVTYCKKNP